jgi:hypothetical protein
MPLFVCESCGCVENTATCNFWKAKRERTPYLCSACDPACEQHDHFPLEPWDGERDVLPPRHDGVGRTGRTGRTPTEKKVN